MHALIDCHALTYSADTARYPMQSGLDATELDHCTEAAALRKALDTGAITGAVLVQRNRFYGFGNRLICDLAGRDARLRALVSVDTRAPDSASEARRLLALPGVAGVRFMESEKGAGLDWLAGQHADAVWSAVADAGALADVHLFPWNRGDALPLLAGLMDQYRNVPVLLDNLGNGPVDAGPPAWGLDAALAPVVDRPGLTLKFSEMTLGRIERANRDPVEALAAVVDRVGPERLVWGSDVLTPKVSLTEAAARATAALPVSVRDIVLARTAARLFDF